MKHPSLTDQYVYRNTSGELVTGAWTICQWLLGWRKWLLLLQQLFADNSHLGMISSLTHDEMLWKGANGLSFMQGAIVTVNQALSLFRGFSLVIQPCLLYVYLDCQFHLKSLLVMCLGYPVCVKVFLIFTYNPLHTLFFSCKVINNGFWSN